MLSLSDLNNQGTPVADSFRQFTPRQIQVMDRLSEGLSNKEIAFQLNVTEATVKAYLQGIYGRTRCTNRLKLALQWLQYRGVIEVKVISN